MAGPHDKERPPRDSDAFLEDAEPSAQGESGGRLAREVGSRDEMTHATQPDAKPARPEKSEKSDTAGKGH